MPFLPILDNVPETPIQINGSPVISTDEVTGSMSITRFYAVARDSYVPLLSGAPDPVYTDAYLVNENTDSVQGPIRFFSRNYQQLPDTRQEPLRVVFTIPGRSKETRSQWNNSVIGWDKYGAAAPYTRDVDATVTISYELNPPAVAINPVSVITFNGAPVDFIGSVYENVGAEVIVRPNGNLSEPRFDYLGNTFPLTLPLIWTMENTIERWRGPIWERRVVTVNTILASL